MRFALNQTAAIIGEQVENINSPALSTPLAPSKNIIGQKGLTAPTIRTNA
jgi:hypothetical protein